MLATRSTDRPNAPQPPATHAHLPFAPELDAILEAERRTPLWKPLALTACFLGIVATDLMKVGFGVVGGLWVVRGFWGAVVLVVVVVVVYGWGGMLVLWRCGGLGLVGWWVLVEMGRWLGIEIVGSGFADARTCIQITNTRAMQPLVEVGCSGCGDWVGWCRLLGLLTRARVHTNVQITTGRGGRAEPAGPHVRLGGVLAGDAGGAAVDGVLLHGRAPPHPPRLPGQGTVG